METLTAQALLDDLVQQTISRKKDKASGDGDKDLMAALHLVYEPEREYAICVIPEGPDLIPLVLWAMEAQHNGKRPTLVGFTSDAYMRIAKSMDEVDAIRRGDLKREFEAGRPNTQETLIVLVADVATNTVAGVNVSYVVSEGTPIFEDPMQFDAADYGAVVDGIRAGLHLDQKGEE